MKILLRCFKVQLIILHVLSTSYLLFAMQNTFLMNYLPLTTCGCLSDHFFFITKSTSIHICTPCHFLFHWLDTILSNSKPSLLWSLFSSTYKHAKHINILKPFPCFHILSCLLLHFPPTLSESKIP